MAARPIKQYPDIDPAAPDSWVPDPQVWAEFGVTEMTLWRWTRDKAMNFPQPIQIRKRNFRSRRELEEFKKRMLAEAIAARAGGKRKRRRKATEN